MMIATKTEREAKGKALALGLWLLALMAACLLLAATPAHAATFTVNSTGDAGDNNPGNGSCFTGTLIPGSGVGLEQECTLRAAIQEANANDNDATVVDAIGFNIGGSGVKTIQPTSGLPSITERVTIDGYSQPGSKPNTLASGNNAAPKIQLKGTNAGLANGLVLSAEGSVIRGLVIDRFGLSGVVISIGRTGNEIEGNFIGTDATGTQDLGNDIHGVSIDDASNNTVGGAVPSARNVISGNEGFGVRIDGSANNKIQGNYIGTDKNGTTNLGNSSFGVSINGSNNTVGGAASARNTIAFNGSNGVTVPGYVSNRILSNSIHSNDELGIDLGGDGRTPNDPKDPDIGPNNLQNVPVLTSAVTSGGRTTIRGRLNSTPGKAFALQFFSNPSGTNEGKTFLAQRSVTTNANGNASFTFTFAVAVSPGRRITATATGVEGTSEFSASRTVVAR